MRKSYNTPKRTHIVKTRLNDDEYDMFLKRMEGYGLNQSAFLRKAISGATIRPVIVVSLVNDELLAALGKLTAEYGRIGSNLNQIARHLNEGQTPYVNWAKKHNLKNMSKALVLYEEHGFSSPEELDAACNAANQERSDALAALKDVESAIRDKKELQRHVLRYFKTKPLREGLNACKTDKACLAYRRVHESEFVLLDAAKRFFDAKGLKKLPSHKALQQEIEQLIQEKNQLYNEYQAAKQRVNELNTIRYNLEQTLNSKRSQQPER